MRADAGDGAVAGHRPALARRDAGDVIEGLRIEAELLGHGEALAGGDHGRAEQHVVADFRGLAIARAARVDDRLAHGRQDGLGAFEGGVGAADHEGERAAIGRRDAAGNGGVDHVEAACGRGVDHAAGGGDVDGRAIEEQRAGAGRAIDFARINAFDMLAGGQHGDDGVGVGRGVGGAAGADRAQGFRLGQSLLRQVEGADGIAVLEQVGGHAAAHIAESDEGDGLGHDALLSCLTSHISRKNGHIRARP